MILEAPAEDAGQRLDLFLHRALPQFSRSKLQAWIKSGRIRVGSEQAKPSLLLRGGERIEIEPEAAPPSRALPEDIPLDILYEDGDVIAVNKRAGMVVHEGAGQRSGTLVNALLHRFQTLSQAGGVLRPGIVHRLDRFTSGVLLVARNDQAHANLAAQFASRRVKKTYLALVHGAVRQERGKIERRITRDPVNRVRMTARREHGREAYTEYTVRERWPGFTYLEVRIGTGRTHQIRVHLSSAGHPVVGDRLYGAPARVEGMPELGRFFLHALKISFHLPSSGETMEIEAPLAPELQEWLEALRNR